MLSKFLIPRQIRAFSLQKINQTGSKKLDYESKNLTKQLVQRIKIGGPLTVAEYMKEVLTHPAGGYYMHKDVFGEQGDFITSPEITQMFGEMLAVWFLNEWQKLGSPVPLQFVELGPGRGTLSNDILNVFGHLKALHRASLHLVEVSPALSDIQAKRLCKQVTPISESKVYREGIYKAGIPVKWYNQMQDVPKGFSMFIAHEFFDALPIHKFHKTYQGFREVLIDLDPNVDSPKPHFRYVLAKNKTPMSKYLVSKNENRDHIEVSPDSIFIIENICKRLVECGGIALFCDYGHNGDGTDTFRAFKKHVQVNPLENPGSSDLTADVDFSMIKQVVENVGGVIPYGPISQREFLLKVGLECRFKNLLGSLTDKEHIRNLTASYEMLTRDDKMGKRFKFFAIFPETLRKILDKFPVVGF
ncbi:unnamed protein product [Brassicogethes aeneus]|uniref:Protein arginine methyltransferase NDUFAF7 n=1 Tax=Brassicogethes aeneus TaxID=1431903 RepID=A0A9P0AXJ5_BRAAE|nr:unnamed protein product [Brassicogethes aeneus]